MITTVLVALDGSALAEQAIPLASRIASRAGAELVLMTALVPGERWVGGPTGREWQQEEERAAAGYLESIRESMADVGIRTRTRVGWGRAAVSICALADEEAADLIIMTTHGRSGLARWVMGSVADKVLNTSRKPVLLIRARDEMEPQETKLERILVPLDGSPLAESAIPFAGSLARQLGASLLFLRAVVPPVTMYAGEFVPSAPPLLGEVESNAREYLERVAKETKRRRIAVEVEVSTGHPAEVILDAAERHRVGLIALSSHGRSDPKRWIMGSVADRVIAHSLLPCLLVPARALQESGATEEKRGASREAAVSSYGSVTLPPPTWTETAQEPQDHDVRPPVERPHRPERSPGR